jgi:hypothetical protein
MSYIEFNWETMQQWAVEKTKLLGSTRNKELLKKMSN